jgi:cholesterol oxidase
LHRDRLKIDWPDAALQEVFQRIDQTLGRMTEATGGTYIGRPLAPIRNGKVLTVHPLGGCAMGEDCTTGVVNHKGQVFDASSASSSQIHPGLYVCDGAVVPRSLGVHPLLTITGLAERAMIHLIRDRYSPKQQG